ncbi:phytanoyl-CoA dioxygenase family protein [Longispora urticae]
MTATAHAPAAELAMTPDQREQFDRDGYLIIRGVLTPEEIAHYTAAMDRVYAEHAAAGKLGADGSLHKLSAVASCPELAGLMTHEKVFPLVWSTIGWNVHVYHSHLDVHPKIEVHKPARFEWHQDGGRQNREIETDPRPQLSVKLAFFLTDLSEPGRGNLQVVPGSHKTNWIQGPPRRDMEWPNPEGAIEVQVDPGDVVFFDRRIWHARSNNYSDFTRKVAFFGYTYRWIAIRDEKPTSFDELTPVQRQMCDLLDGRAVDRVEGGDHAWGHFPSEVPLYVQLKEGGHLDPTYPPLKP